MGVGGGSMHGMESMKFCQHGLIKAPEEGKKKHV